MTDQRWHTLFSHPNGDLGGTVNPLASTKFWIFAISSLPEWLFLNVFNPNFFELSD